MFDHRHYVPILLAKRGERSAVRDLPAADRHTMTPLFVVPPVDWNFDTDAPAKTIDQHLQNLAKDLAQAWGAQRAFIDMPFMGVGTVMANGVHPLEWLTSQANAHSMTLVPVVSPGRDPGYQQAVINIVARDGRGACFRLPSAEWPSAATAAPVNTLLTSLALTAQDVDLVLDLTDEVVGAPGLALTAVRNELSVLPHLAGWRSVTVAGAGFPKQLTGYGRGISVIDRIEWQIYQALLASPPSARTPTFGDYAIAHPDPSVDVDPKFMSISAALRYTIADHWLVAKGDLFKGTGGSGLGGAAVPPVAQQLVADARFLAGHCDGDDWLTQVAAGTTGGGNPEAWRRIGTLHHLTLVSRTVANPPASSGGGGPAPGAP